MEIVVKQTIINAIENIEELIESETYYENVETYKIQEELNTIRECTDIFNSEICEIEEELGLKEYEICYSKILNIVGEIKNFIIKKL